MDLYPYLARVLSVSQKCQQPDDNVHNVLDGLAYCQMLFDAQGHPVDFIYIQVNKSFEKLTGLKDVIGKKVTEVIPGIETSNQKLFEIYGRVSLTGEPEKFETYIEPLSKWFLVSVYCPQKKFFVAIFENITDRKLVEKDLEMQKVAARNVLEDLQAERVMLAEAKAKSEALAKDLDKFRLAVEKVSDVILITDPEGIVIYANRAIEKITGYKPEEAVGKKGGTLWKTPMPSEYYQKLWDTIKKQKKFFGGEIQNKRKNGEIYTSMLSISPVLSEKSEIEFFVGVERDITKEKEIDHAKSEFISLASHQLKTPPTAIKLLTERLLGGKIGKLTEKQKEYFEDIRSSNQRMIDLVNALLNVSRIELGEFYIQVSEKDACAVVRGILNELKPIIGQKHLELKTMFQKENVLLMLDEPLFRIAISNLIINSIHYTADGGEIRVECKVVNKGQTLGEKFLRENCFVVVVSDTGLGIPQDEQSKVFVKFFRGNSAREKHVDGTGLGLYIVKSILNHSGGLIWFTSRENEGSAFYVAVPMTGMRARAGEKWLIG